MRKKAVKSESIKQCSATEIGQLSQIHSPFSVEKYLSTCSPPKQKPKNRPGNKLEGSFTQKFGGVFHICTSQEDNDLVAPETEL